MEHLHNGYTLELCPGSFPLSTDSIALSAFAKLSKNARVLDLGSGCGTLGLLLCARDESCHVTGVELDPNSDSMALRNARENHIEHRLTSICADLRNIPSFIAAAVFPVAFPTRPISHLAPKANPFPMPGGTIFAAWTN